MTSSEYAADLVAKLEQADRELEEQRARVPHTVDPHAASRVRLRGRLGDAGAVASLTPSTRASSMAAGESASASRATIALTKGGFGMPVKHGLGFGNGRLVEYDDGTVAYYKTGELTQAFRVPIAEVQSFSVVKGGKMLERTLNIMGSGTCLASVSINHGTAEKIEQWFRRHPQWRDNAPVSAKATAALQPQSSVAPAVDDGLLIGDELRKLAELRSEGILTDDEFAARKALLLARGT